MSAVVRLKGLVELPLFCFKQRSCKLCSNNECNLAQVQVILQVMIKKDLFCFLAHDSFDPYHIFTHCNFKRIKCMWQFDRSEIYFLFWAVAKQHSLSKLSLRK